MVNIVVSILSRCVIIPLYITFNLNNYYVNVGPEQAKEHNKKWDKESCGIEIESKFNFKWITVKEVERLVKDICLAKASALDELSTKLLKDAFEILCFELAYMYNSCLQNGIFPKTWGLSKVTPIPKTNKNSSDPKDWRPISQIALPGKILEKNNSLVNIILSRCK